MNPADVAEQERIRQQQWAAERAGDEARRQAMAERQESAKRAKIIEQSRGFVGKVKDRIHQYNEKREAKSIESMERKTQQSLERSAKMQRHVEAKEAYVKARSGEIDLINRKKNSQKTLRSYERDHPTTLTGKFAKGVRSSARETKSLGREFNEVVSESRYVASSPQQHRYQRPPPQESRFTQGLIGSFQNIALPESRERRLSVPQKSRGVNYVQQGPTLQERHINLLTNFGPSQQAPKRKANTHQSSNHLNMLTNTANFGFNTKRKRSAWAF